MTQIYNQYQIKISNHCLSRHEYEALYGNKSKFGLVFPFAALLIDDACKQIGLNELHHQFDLKTQQVSFDNVIEEVFNERNTSKKPDSATLMHFQKEVQKYSKNVLSATKFWPEDIQTAEKFLDQKFPEIRELFRLKYEELRVRQKPFDKKTIDEAFLEFIQMQAQIINAVEYVNRQSSRALYREIN